MYMYARAKTGLVVDVGLDIEVDRFIWRESIHVRQGVAIAMFTYSKRLETAESWCPVRRGLADGISDREERTRQEVVSRDRINCQDSTHSCLMTASL